MPRPVCVISGTTHGIGNATARELARRGYHVVMANRDATRAEAVAEDIRAAVAEASIETVTLDLARLRSVRRAATAVGERHPAIALLVNNAGVMRSRRADSADGYELMLAVNHLGPALLTHDLLPALRAADDAHIVNVASRAHLRGHIDFDDLMWRRRSFRWRQAYADSKLAQVLFTLALARQLESARIRVNCLHPGVLATNIFPRDHRLARLAAPVLRRALGDATVGATATVKVATDPADGRHASGHYFDATGHRAEPAAEARDRDVQRRLWMVTGELLGLGNMRV